MKEFKPHENGMHVVECGSIINKSSGNIVENPAVCIDMNTGSMMKVGDMGMVESWYNTAVHRFLQNDMTKDAESLQLIKFEKYEKLSQDEICTMMNYMANSIGEEKMKELLSMDEAALHEKLARLAEIGW